jgi:hypothetical protein
LMISVTTATTGGTFDLAAPLGQCRSSSVSLGDGLSDVIKFGVSESFSMGLDLEPRPAQPLCRLGRPRQPAVRTRAAAVGPPPGERPPVGTPTAGGRPWNFSQARAPPKNCAGGAGGPGGLCTMDANPASSRTSTTADPAPLYGMVVGLSLAVCRRRIVGNHAALAATEAAQLQPAGSSRQTAPSHGDRD